MIVRPEFFENVKNIVQKLLKEPVNITIVEYQHKNISELRAQAIASCNTKYVSWIDDDDDFELGLFKNLVSNACGKVVYPLEICLRDGKEVFRNFSGEEPTLDEIKLKKKVHHAMLIDRETALSYTHHMLRFPLVGDQLLIWMCCTKLKWKHVPGKTYFWIRHPTQITANPEVENEIRRVKTYFWKHYNDKSNYDFYKKQSAY